MDAATPMITTTTISSTRVKPRSPRRRSAPVAEVGILALPALLAVGAEGIDVEGPVLARRGVLVVVAPRVLGQAADVAALAVALGVGQARRGGDQRLQPVLAVGKVKFSSR